MSTNQSLLNFWSGANYMKRDVSSGTATITLNSSGGVVTYTVTHNLGFIPFYQVFSEIDQAGIIWVNNKVNDYTGTSLSGASLPYPTISSWATTTQLVINLDNTFTYPIETGTVPIYWLIYLDYGNV